MRSGSPVDGAAKDDQRPLGEVRRQLVDRLVEDGHRGVEELIDGRADDHDDDGHATDVPESVEAARRPVGSICPSSSSAPVSWNGIRPSRMDATVRAEMSKMATRSPTSASLSDSGRPTWPPPPTTTMSCGATLGTGRTLVPVCCLSWIITLIWALPYPCVSTTWVR